MALLIGFGAAAVNPYLALDSIDDMISEGLLEGVSPRQARRNYVKAACKGVLKVMSKMGISTVASYTGAQVFEAIGLDGALIDEYFTGTASRIGGVGLVGAGGRGGDAPPGGPRRPADRAGPPRARGGRRVPVAPRGRVPPLQPQDGVQAPARHPVQALRHLQGVQHRRRRPGREAGDAARAAAPEAGAGWPDPARGGRAGLVHPDPLLHRRHVLRLHLGRGAPDAGHRHEPPRAGAPTRARAARTPTASRPTPTATSGAAPSSRWPRAASA